MSWEHTKHQKLSDVGVGPAVIDEWQRNDEVIQIVAWEDYSWRYRVEGTRISDIMRFNRRSDARDYARELMQ